MYSTRTRVHARIPNGHSREDKRACRTKVRGQVGELNGLRAPRQADCDPREDPRAEVGEEVRVAVSVGVRVGPVEFKLTAAPYGTPSDVKDLNTTVQQRRVL